MLAGGGNLGAIQVGQLRALAERGVVPDLIVGCSAGAMNGVGFAHHPNVAGVDRIEAIWHRFETSPDLVLPGSWLPSPLQLLRKGNAIATHDNMRERLKEFLGSARTFEDLDVAFECVATDVDANAEAWFSTGDLIEPILASSALPSVFPMVTIGGRRYMDGGVLNNVPINRALDRGATQIYVLHMGLHGKPSHTVKRPLDAAMIAYWIARNGRFARDLASVPSSVELFVIPPGERPDLKYNDFSRSRELIEQGYEHALGFFAEQDRHLEESSTARAERLRSETRRVIDELRGKVESFRASRAHDGYVDLGVDSVDSVDTVDSGDGIDVDASGSGLDDGDAGEQTTHAGLA